MLIILRHTHAMIIVYPHKPGIKAKPHKCDEYSARAKCETDKTGSTSVKSSMFAGLLSTMLKAWELCSMCHRLIRRSSALKKVASSLEQLMLLM